MRHKALRIPLFILLALVALTAGSYVTMLLWNALIPAIFHITTITFCQALGLLVLARLLFGFHHGGGHGHKCCGRRHHRNWEKLTPEEREKIMQRMANDDCCGPWGWHKAHFGENCCEDKKDSEEK